MDRVSGSSKSPYGAQPTPEKATEGRVRASRTHARQQSRVDQGLNLADVEKKWTGTELEKVHVLVTELADPVSDNGKIAGKITKLCETFKDRELSQLFASKLRELKPETRAAIGRRLDWVTTELKSADAGRLVTAIQIVISNLAKS
jgi:hypothetical protein